MKFAIILLSCFALANCWGSRSTERDLLVEGSKWGKHWDSSRRYECQYVPELRVISCFRGLVECETVPRFEGLPQTYEIFAIGSSDMVKFNLYPRNFSELLYTDSRVNLPTGQVEMRLFSSEEESVSNIRGLMVRDVRCYRRIVDLIKVINNPVEVELTSRQRVTVLSYIVNLLETAEQHRLHSSEILADKLVTLGRPTEKQSLERITDLEASLEDSTRRFECRYLESLEMLSCFRGLVNCETEFRMTELTKRYEVFGLGTTDMTTYRLYPRNMTDVKYSSNRQPTVDGRTVELGFLRSGVEGHGFLVRDAVCYQRIIDFLRVIPEPVMVDVTGESSNVRVQMMGYIITV